MSGKVPQLLVSVRDAHEALDALRGGADIIDVKEPANGSLGRAAASAIISVADVIVSGIVDSSSAFPLSLALGEVSEWLDPGPTSQIAGVPAVIQRTQPQFLKLGLSGLCSSVTAGTDWFDSWMQVRNRIAGEHSWVAAAYADAIRAQAPAVADICRAAVKSQCRVLLIDTFGKDQSTLLDWLSCHELRQLRTDTAAHGLLLALAGRISAGDLTRLSEFQPDIIAVRGAVCEHGVRTSAISEERVREFRCALQMTKSL